MTTPAQRSERLYRVRSIVTAVTYAILVLTAIISSLAALFKAYQ
jgi:hypothetical protein